MKINAKDFKFLPGKKIKLDEWRKIVKTYCKGRKTTNNFWKNTLPG